ncbi:hypothetical protein Ancab_011074, partial [Ancistrocladus abbreviatus]
DKAEAIEAWIFNSSDNDGGKPLMKIEGMVAIRHMSRRLSLSAREIMKQLMLTTE